MGKMASDGSEGSEGKEGGSDSILFPNLSNNLEILNEIRRNFMGSNASSDGSEGSEAKESSESSKFPLDKLLYQNENKLECSNEMKIKKEKVNKISLLVF